MSQSESGPPQQLSLFGGSSALAPGTATPGAPSSRGRGDFAVRVRRNSRARRLILRVHPRGTVEIVAPRRTPGHEIDSFVASHREWIERQRASFAAAYPPESFSLPDRIALPALGEDWRLDYRVGRSRLRVTERPGRAADDRVLRVMRADDDDGAVVAALKRWLRERARAHFHRIVPPLAGAMGASVARVQVRAQKTRWGSFSSSGTLSLNVCALFVRPALVRYLCVHELAHFHHMDHSPAFWATVARFEPDYRELDSELGAMRDAMPAWLGLE